MRTETTRLKIDDSKKNVVLIGDALDLMDIVEIYLYKRYNVIATIDEFDGMKKIEAFKPACIFIKTTAENTDVILAFLAKLSRANEALRNIPVIAYSKEENTTINEFKLKSAGVREIIKFPINWRDFVEVVSSVITRPNSV